MPNPPTRHRSWGIALTKRNRLKGKTLNNKSFIESHRRYHHNWIVMNEAIDRKTTLIDKLDPAAEKVLLNKRGGVLTEASNGRMFG